MIPQRNSLEAESPEAAESKRIKDAPCLLQAPDGGAVMVFIDEYDGEYAAIKPRKGHYKQPLWFKRASLFEANQALLDQIVTAYKKGHASGLRALWLRALPW